MTVPENAKAQRTTRTHLEDPLNLRIPAVVTAALSSAAPRELESRSNYVRRAIVRSLRLDGLLPEIPALERAAPAEEMPRRAP
jgi:hypothetical protein